MTPIRFRLRTLLLVVAVVSVTLLFAIRQYELTTARSAYERTHEAWVSVRVTCEDLIAVSRELSRIEKRWLWRRYSVAEAMHLNRLKQLLKRAEAAQPFSTHATLEGYEHDVKLLRREILAIEQPTGSPSP